MKRIYWGLDRYASEHHVITYTPFGFAQDSEIAIRWAVENVYRPGDVFHLLHVIPEPQMVHIWAGVYIPPDDDAELLEVEDTKHFVKHRFAKVLVDAKASLSFILELFFFSCLKT
jgi:hypothetical protein